MIIIMKGGSYYSYYYSYYDNDHIGMDGSPVKVSDWCSVELQRLPVEMDHRGDQRCHLDERFLNQVFKSNEKY